MAPLGQRDGVLGDGILPTSIEPKQQPRVRNVIMTFGSKEEDFCAQAI